jgi:hypothetical protein
LAPSGAGRAVSSGTITDVVLVLAEAALALFRRAPPTTLKGTLPMRSSGPSAILVGEQFAPHRSRRSPPTWPADE